MKIGIQIEQSAFSAPLQCQRNLYGVLRELDTGFDIVPVRGPVPKGLDLLHVDRIPSTHWEFIRARRAPKVVAHVHGNLIYTNPELCEIPLRRRLTMKLGEKIGSQMVDHFMPVSNYLREWMVDRGADRRRVTTVHNGVHPLFFKEPDKKFRVVGNYILHVSKWAPKKNTRAIVNALPIIQDAHPYMRLVIVGPGHKEQNYNSEYVKVMGKLPVEWLPQMYAGAKAFVFPSLHETFGIPVAEAMAAGCPVVTTPNCSLPEVAGAAAEYCDHTPRGIARSVIRVLDDPERREIMSENGRERALQFTWEKAARKVVKVYEKVLA